MRLYHGVAVIEKRVVYLSVFVSCSWTTALLPADTYSDMRTITAYEVVRLA